MRFFSKREVAPRKPRAPVTPVAATHPARPVDLSEQARRALQSVASIRWAKPGEMLVREGDQGTGLTVIVEGNAALTTSAAGPASELAVLGPGEWLGSLDPGVHRSAGTLTAQDACRWMAVSPSAVDLLMPSDQLAVNRWLVMSTEPRVQGLLQRHAEARREAAALLVMVRGHQAHGKEVIASKALQEIMASIPKLPTYASNLVAKLLDDRTHADEVVEAIKDDASLAALVLKTVNSAAYGMPTKISDYYHAFLHLGAMKVYQLVVTSGVQSVLPDTAETHVMYQHARLISLIAYEICQLSPVIRPELAVTLGLLHDVGKAIAPVVAQRRPELAPVMALLDPAPLGAALLRSWGLPDGVVEPIASQGEPELVPPDAVDEACRSGVALLYLAHLCEDRLVDPKPGATPTTHEAAYLTALKLRERTCTELWDNRLLPAMRRHGRHLLPTSRRPSSADLAPGVTPHG